MKYFNLKIISIFIFFVITLCLIYRDDISNRIFKKDIHENLNWAKYSNLFPSGFNPNMTNAGISELGMLNTDQRAIFDSIINNYYNYPRKAIRFDEENQKIYSVEVEQSLSIRLKIGETKKITFQDLKKYNEIELDSFIKIVPDIKIIRKKNRNNNIRFNIIVFDTNFTIEMSEICIENKMIYSKNAFLDTKFL